MTEISDLVEKHQFVTIKQQRIYVLCSLRLPKEVREKTPQQIVKNGHGEFLLGFSYPPKKGDRFPYQNQIWELLHDPIQFPARYKTQQKKHPASAICKWLHAYESLEEAIHVILGLNPYE